MAGNYDVAADIWPDLSRGNVALAPVRVGVNRQTGKVLIGWEHTEQSLYVLFATRYHERIIRRWVGSFVPHLLGESATERVITRFFWAIATAVELWEPNYRINRVRVLNRDGTDPGDVAPSTLTTPEEIRRGELTFKIEGVHRPRAHLGDFTPEGRRTVGLIGNGQGRWERFTPQ